MKLFRRNQKPEKAEPQGPLLATPLGQVAINDHTEAQKGDDPRAASIQLPRDSINARSRKFQPIPRRLVPELAAKQTSSANESESSAKPTISVNQWSLPLRPLLRLASDDSMRAQWSGGEPRAPEIPLPYDNAEPYPVALSNLLKAITPTSPANKSEYRGRAKSKVSVNHQLLPLSSSSNQASSNASMIVHLGSTWSEPGAPGEPERIVYPEDVMSDSFPRIQPRSLAGSGRTSPDNGNGVGDSMHSPNRDRWGSGIPGPSQPHRPAHGRFAPGRGASVEEKGGDEGIDDQMDWIPSLEILMTNHTPLNLSGQIIIPNRVNPAHGGLADVYTGLWNDRMVPPKQDDTRLLTSLKVAVKVLRIRKSRRADADLEASNERRIAREMHVWAALKHPNISEFLGYSTDFGDYPSMISTVSIQSTMQNALKPPQWCKQGTASEYLDQQQRPVNERVRLAQDVSDGLEFLHLLKIVHGDLKPSNVLVDDACVARLCDFGLVRLVDWEGPAGMTTTSPYMGTERYKAPELFISTDNRHPVATFEGDIYSLGCIILEFIEQVYPFQRFRRNYDLRNAIMDGYSPALRSEATDSLLDRTNTLWDLLEVCWDEALRRPIVSVVVKVLDSLVR